MRGKEGEGNNTDSTDTKGRKAKRLIGDYRLALKWLLSKSFSKNFCLLTYHTGLI